ncbi:MAG: hypothetical protein Q7T96_01600 [Methylobacter sp.]|nr:hypothetical protein [Methylobacter sp.]
MANLKTRLLKLQQRLQPTVGAPALIFADDMDECTVGDVVLYRLTNESDDQFYDRCNELYDHQCGTRPALSVRIRCAELMQ